MPKLHSPLYPVMLVLAYLTTPHKMRQEAARVYQDEFECKKRERGLISAVCWLISQTIRGLCYLILHVAALHTVVSVAWRFVFGM